MVHVSETQAAPSQEGRDQQLVNIAVGHFYDSRDGYQSFRTSLQDKYDIVRGGWAELEGLMNVGWNNVPVNFLHSMIQSDIAKKILTLFGERPYVQFVGSGQEDQAKARKRSSLVERQFDAANGKEEMSRFICGADYYGKAVGRYHWQREYGGTYTRERTFRGTRIAGTVDPRTGMRGIKFDGPSWYNVDLVDFFPWRGVSRLAKMPGVGEQSFPDWEDVVLGSERGPDGEQPIYDPAAIAKARYDGGPQARVEDIINGRWQMSASNPDDRYAQMKTSWAKPCHIFEYQGRVPRELGMYDPETGEWCTNLRIVVLNLKHLIAVTPIPFWDRKPPYFDWGPLVDPHYFYPPGKVELTMRLQAAINKWVSRGLDLLDLYADPLWIFDENSGLDPEQLFTGPGNAVGANLNGNSVKDVIAQLVPDLRGYNVTLDQVSLLWQWMQQVMGMSADISLGAGEVGSDRQSAHEWVGRERAIDLRQRLELFLLEEQALIPLLNSFVLMDRQWLQLPTEISIIGSDAVFDQVSGRMIPPTREILDYDDLEGHMDTYPLGVTRQLSSQSRQANVERVLPLLQPFMPAMNMRAFIMQILPMYGFPNVAELTNTEAQMAQALAMGVGIESGRLGGGADSGAAGGASTRPPTNRVRQAAGAPGVG